MTSKVLIKPEQERQIKPLPSPSTRNYGIDALRILSMLMVVTLHILGQGGVLYNGTASQLNRDVAWLLEAAAFCAVDCYALVSGYVGADAKFKYSNLIVLWLQVLFYTVGITLVMQLGFPDYLGTATLKDSFLPVTKKLYWYFTCYVGLFFLIPFLNRLIHALDRRAARNYCITVLIAFSAFQISSNQNMFVFTNGYTMIWLVLLYVLGGCFKKHGFFSRVPKPLPILVYACSVFSAWLVKMMIDGMEDTASLPAAFRTSNFLINYTAPTILIAAISLLVFFANIKHVPRPIAFVIKLLTPLAFNVYIIHTHPSVWQKLLKGRFAPLALLEPHMMVFRVLRAAIGIFLFCAAIDLVRHLIFKLFHVKEFFNGLEEALKERAAKRKPAEDT